MKTILRSLACAALCVAAVTSCVGPYDQYGYGGVAPVGGYYGRVAPVGGYYGRGYPGYSGYSGYGYPGYSSLSVGYFGGSPLFGGYGNYNSWNNPYRYSSYRSGYPGYSSRYSSRSYPYAAANSRGSSFRGQTTVNTPAIPNFSPRTITRPSSSGFRSSPTPSIRSGPAPSGRASRPVTTVSRSSPSVSTRSSAGVTSRGGSASISAGARAATDSRFGRGR